MYCRTILLTLAMSLTHTGLNCEAEEARMTSGDYGLQIKMPSQAEPENRDVTLPAKVKVEQNSIVLDTTGLSGNAIKLRGVISGGKVKFGLTSPEDESLITMIFTGNVDENKSAKGKLAILVDGKKVANATWALKPAEEKKDSVEDS